MLIAALTGNFGMGKSSVAALFRRYGAVTIDSDEIVSNLLIKKNIVKHIRDMFGDEVMNPDSSLNRRAVADRVFKDHTARKRLESYLHPLVFKEIKSRIRNIKDSAGIVIVEVPLLFEGGFQKEFQRTITVYTSKKTAVSRLIKKGISRKDALARLQAQMDIRLKKKLSDYSIDNSGTIGQTELQVRQLLHELTEYDMPRLSRDQDRF